MDWLKNAACRAMATKDFFENFEAKDAGGRMKALSVCASCKSRVDCQQYAESFSDTYGLWGGYFYRDGIRRDAMKIRRLVPSELDGDLVTI